MRADVPFNRLSSSPSANNPTSSPPSRAQNRRGRFSRPSHLCQAEIHSQERNGDALVALKSACHSGANNDKASDPLISSTTNLLTSTPRLILTVPRDSTRLSHKSAAQQSRAGLYRFVPYFFAHSGFSAPKSHPMSLPSAPALL